MGTSRRAKLRAQYQAALSAVGIPPPGQRPKPPRPALVATVAAAWLVWIPWPIVADVKRDNDWAFTLAPLPVAALLFITCALTLAPTPSQPWALRWAVALAAAVMALTGWDGGQALGSLFLATVCGIVPAATAAWAVVLLWRHSTADWHERQTGEPA